MKCFWSSSLGLSQLREDVIHDPGSQKDLPVAYRQRRTIRDGAIEGFDQVFHARFHVEVVRQESSHVSRGVAQVLFGQDQRRKKMLRDGTEPPKESSRVMI